MIYWIFKLSFSSFITRRLGSGKRLRPTFNLNAPLRRHTLKNWSDLSGIISRPVFTYRDEDPGSTFNSPRPRDVAGCMGAPLPRHSPLRSPRPSRVRAPHAESHDTPPPLGARVSSVMSGYSLIMTPPPLRDYLRLRVDTGLSPKTEQQGAAGLFGAWAACHVVHEETRTVVGMGRLLGDGGWYFHVIDMAVLPEHQRRGLGDAILTALLNRIRAVAPPGAYVNLLADLPGRSLYERHGFTETAPHSVGMALRL